jgi:hypothetical protein
MLDLLRTVVEHTCMLALKPVDAGIISSHE